MDARIVDANLNRVSEGLRVIEEYVRFVLSHADLSTRLATARHKLNQTETAYDAHLMGRDVTADARAYAPPAKRQDVVSLLRANFKRVTEGLRVLEEYTGNSVYNQLRYDIYMLEKEVVLAAAKPQVAQGVYVISDTVSVLLQAVADGATVIQLRDKYATKATIYDKAKALREAHRDSRIPLMINDHADIALAIGADGLHTGQDDIPLGEQRHLLGHQRLLGRTTHTLAQGKQAAAEGADYVSVGPIWETPSKPGREGIGHDYLSQARTLGIPYVAIGGISLANLSMVLAYAPPMVGVIRAHGEVREIVALFENKNRD